MGTFQTGSNKVTKDQPLNLQGTIEADINNREPLDDLAILVRGNNEFAFDLYQALDKEGGNLFFSPFSVSSTMAMVYAGARNNTAKQMAKVLHFELAQEDLHPAFSILKQRFDSNSDFRLTIANSLWKQEGYPFRQKYLDTIANNYDTYLGQVNFIDDNDRELARLEINSWIKKATGNKINELIRENMLNYRTRLVLVNAIYFKATWDTIFHPSATHDEFKLLNGTTMSIPTMTRKAISRYLKTDKYQVIEILYKGQEMSMIIILPNEGQFEMVEGLLNNQFITDIISNLKETPMQLYLPKFQFETQIELKKSLADMGMTDATSNKADFSGVDGTLDLLLAHVMHKAIVSVDELGTEALAATAGWLDMKSDLNNTVMINRPFIFLIRDIKTNTFLFVGRFLEPIY